MKPMYLREVENKRAEGGVYAQAIEAIRASGAQLPQILHLFAYKPETTVHFEPRATPQLRRNCWTTRRR